MTFTTIADDTTYGSGTYNDSSSTYSGTGSSTSQTSNGSAASTASPQASGQSSNQPSNQAAGGQGSSQTSSGTIQAATQNGVPAAKSYTDLWIGLILIAICLIGFIILLVKRRHRRITDGEY